MGIMMTKEFDKNADLTRRINADLRAKAEGTSGAGGSGKAGGDSGKAGTKRAEDPDLVEDSEYAKDFNKTSRFAWVWILIAALVVAILIGLGISKH